MILTAMITFDWNCNYFVFLFKYFGLLTVLSVWFFYATNRCNWISVISFLKCNAIPRMKRISFLLLILLIGRVCLFLFIYFFSFCYTVFVVLLLLSCGEIDTVVRVIRNGKWYVGGHLLILILSWNLPHDS